MGLLVLWQRNRGGLVMTECAPCICNVNHPDEKHGSHEILYCPLHAAAPDLLVALKELGQAYGVDETMIRLLIDAQRLAWEQACAVIIEAEEVLVEEACPVCDRTDDHGIGECLDRGKEN